MFVIHSPYEYLAIYFYRSIDHHRLYGLLCTIDYMDYFAPWTICDRCARSVSPLKEQLLNYKVPIHAL